MSPLYNDIAPSLALLKENSDNENSEQSTLHQALYALEQFQNNFKTSCYLYAQLSDSAIDFLKRTCKMKLDPTKNQKELTAELVVKDVLYNSGKFIYIIEVDENTLEAGNQESVDVPASRYNFHSHPHEAYVRHSVSNAWPSITDFLGYYSLGDSTIFHCVATLEGLYVMSFSSYWGTRLKQVSKKFIDQNYEIDNSEKITPEEYINRINSILYKGYPIFKVMYFTWDEADTVFKIFFPRTGSSCIPSQDTLEIYNEIHA
jgi:hypothetical protein